MGGQTSPPPPISKYFNKKWVPSGIRTLDLTNDDPRRYPLRHKSLERQQKQHTEYFSFNHKKIICPNWFKISYSVLVRISTLVFLKKFLTTGDVWGEQVLSLTITKSVKLFSQSFLSDKHFDNRLFSEKIHLSLLWLETVL